jgi:drug/metabolite transporter (DMT)-like permease
MISKKVKGLSLGMAATCFWGGFYPVSRMLFGYDDGSVDPLNFTLIRFALATLFLSPLFLSKIQRQRAADMLRNDALMIFP